MPPGTIHAVDRRRAGNRDPGNGFLEFQRPGERGTGPMVNRKRKPGKTANCKLAIKQSPFCDVRQTQPGGNVLALHVASAPDISAHTVRKVYE